MHPDGSTDKNTTSFDPPVGRVSGDPGLLEAVVRALGRRWCSASGTEEVWSGAGSTAGQTVVVDRAEVGGTLRYRSGIGLGLFVTWCCGVVAMLVAAAVGAFAEGEPPWYFVSWILLVLGLGVFSMSLEVSLTATGELVFRGLHRPRRWHVTELRGFGPGNGCLVFKFEKGRAMLAGGGWGRGWDALYVRIAELNPDARL
jgi:hypothetical protein